MWNEEFVSGKETLGQRYWGQNIGNTLQDRETGEGEWRSCWELTVAPDAAITTLVEAML